MRKPYHSSLKCNPPLKIEGMLSQGEKNGSHVICHDICHEKTLPKEFARCDVLYSEPAWRSGYKTFLERADKNESTYEQYITAINKIIDDHRNHRAIWLIIGSHVLGKIVEPERVLEVRLHGYATNLCGWNDSSTYEAFQTNYDFIHLLARRYKCVGDFCCGYGNTGCIFREHGKAFIMSDINPHCIYYVAKTLLRGKNDATG